MAPTRTFDQRMDFLKQEHDVPLEPLAVTVGLRNMLVPSGTKGTPASPLIVPGVPGSAPAKRRRSTARRRPARSREKAAVRPPVEPIYNAVYLVPRGDLRRELRRQGERGGDARQLWPDATWRRCIRPPGIGDRSIPGQWEGDLIVGPRGSAVGTLIERLTSFMVLVGITRDAFRRTEEALFRGAGKSLAYQQALIANTGLNVYFADPRSSWQRPGNEDTGKLLRNRLPDIAQMAEFNQDQLDSVAHGFNTKPRKRHGYRTPLQAYSDLLLSNGITTLRNMKP